MIKNRAFLIILCFIMSACGTTAHRVTVEPGPSWMRPWERPYSVDGMRYVPLLKADGFREEGLASWYGMEEHGNPTSNGEVFDRFKPTAAHKTLPMGSFIRVTNKANGRSTVVRVNDRGPFVPGRIVDLSQRAAQDLAMVEGGVVPVLIEWQPTGQRSAGSVAVVEEEAYYTLQVGAFSDRNMALLASEKLEKAHFYSVIRKVETERGCFYRVHAGKFRSRSEAEAARSSFARNGYPDAFVVTW